MTKKRTYYILFILFSVIYIVGTLIAPLAPNRFNLSTAETRLLQVTIALPVVLIWFGAVFGAERFKRYTSAIKGHPDGKAFNKVATGFTLLVVSIIANGINGIVRPWAVRDGWLEAYTIFSNYLAVLLPLIAYGFMYVGSVELLKLTKRSKSSNQNSLIAGAVLFIIAVFYILVVFNYDYRNFTPDPTRYRSFYLNDIAILFTLVIPYLIGWGLGIKAALNLSFYRQKVKGVVYQGALFRLVLGTLFVVAFGVILQLFIGLSTYFAQARLGNILLIVYLLITFYAAGFLVIASGTRKLSKIEEV